MANSFGTGSTLTITNRAQRHYLAAVGGGGQTCNTCDFSTGNYFGISPSGYKTFSKDAGGGISTYSYDSQGNLASKSLSKGSRAAAPTGIDTSTYTYNSLGEVLTATDPLASQPGDPNHTTVNTYDSHGNLLSVTTPSPD